MPPVLCLACGVLWLVHRLCITDVNANGIQSHFQMTDKLHTTENYITGKVWTGLTKLSLSLTCVCACVACLSVSKHIYIRPHSASFDCTFWILHVLWGQPQNVPVWQIDLLEHAFLIIISLHENEHDTMVWMNTYVKPEYMQKYHSGKLHFISWLF
jgi:hypothetical protein